MELHEEIQKCHIPNTIMEDLMVLKLTPSSEFTVKSSYNYSLEGGVALGDWMDVRHPWILPRINFFCWMTLHRSILIIDNLQKRGFQLANYCVLGLSMVQSIQHLLIQCPYALDV